MDKMLQKIEKKITTWRIKSNHTGTVLFILTIFTLTFMYAMEMTKAFRVNKTLENDQVNKSTYDSAEYIKNVETLLTKFEVTNTPEQRAKILAEVWKQSNLAKTNLVELPSNQKTIEDASNYLSQLSDYSFVLMKTCIDGENIKDKDINSLKKMREYATDLRIEFASIVDDLNDGSIKWDEVQKALEKQNKNKNKENKTAVETIGIEDTSKVFQDYEGLIYDGAFSSHIMNIKPKMLKGKDISVKDGEKIIEKLYKKSEIESIKYTGETKGRIETYGYDLKLLNHDENIDIQITKDSGYVLWILTDKNVKNSDISINEAKKKGKEFLEKLGYKNMKDTYYSIYENMITINYAYEENGCIMYTDLIKVKVSLDDGMICSMESHGYINNHIDNRKLDTKISIEEASNKLNKNLKVEGKNLAIIPTEAKSEKLVYEFKGKINDKYFLVYIDAKTGAEEKILIVIDSEKGILTM